MTQHPAIQDERANIWSLRAPLRVLIFTWLMLRNRILTVDNLVRRGWNMPNRCSMCKRKEETVKHLFRQCSYIAELKYKIERQMRLPSCLKFRTGNYKEAMLSSQYTEVKKVQITTCFVLWRERCRRIFRDEEKPVNLLVQEVITEYNSWYT